MERHRRRYQLAVAVVLVTVLATVSLAVPRHGPVRDGTEDTDVAAPVLETVGDMPVARTAVTELSSRTLQDEASARIEQYRQEGAYSLECAGYLDLFGNVWGCIVQGDGWVDILVIRSTEQGTSSVQTIRLDARQGGSGDV